MKKVLFILALIVISFYNARSCSWSYIKADCTGGCINGSITLHLPAATGNTVNFNLYQYQPGYGWNLIGVKSIFENNSNETWNNLPMGDYYINASSTGGCTETTYYTIVDNSPCNIDFYLTSTNTNPLCNTGTITINVTATETCFQSFVAEVLKDGNPYGTYNFGELNYTLFDLPHGDYQVFIHELNQNGKQCTNVTSILVNTDTCAFDFIAYASNEILNCSLASIDVIANTGCATNYATTLSLNGSVIQSFPNDISHHHFGGLLQGHYTVTITATGPNGTCTQTKNIDIDPPPLFFFNVVADVVNVSVHGCNSGYVTITPSNIYDPYFYNFWSVPFQNCFNFYLYDSNWDIINNGQDCQSYTFFGLAAGTYYIQTIGTRYDAQFCNVPRITQMTITEPPCFTLSASATNVTHKYCNNNDGTITACISTTSYDCISHIYVFDSLNIVLNEWEYNLDGPCPVTFYDFSPGTYRVEAYAGTCSATSYVTIADDPCTFSLADYNFTQINGLHGCNGNQLKVNSHGCYTVVFNYLNLNAPYNQGTLNYNNNFDFYESADNLAAGTYRITGHNGACTDSILFIVTDPVCSLQLSAAGSNVATCSGTVTGTVANYCTSVKVVLKKSSNNVPVDSVITTNGNFSFGLLTNGKYKVYVTSDGGCTSSKTVTVSNVLCPVPTGITSTQTGIQKIKIAWDAIPCAAGYSLQYKKANATTWTTVTLNGHGAHTKQLTNLTLNQLYKYRVRTNCTSVLSSGYSAISTFCVGGGCVARTTHDISETENKSELSVFPNPAKDMINISFDGDIDKAVDIKVYDQIGREVITKSKVDITDDFQLDVSSLTNGLYIISIITEGEKYSSRFIVNR